MPETTLVHVHSNGKDNSFVGCGVLIEDDLIATCRHVWEFAAQGSNVVEIRYPRVAGPESVTTAHVVDECQSAGPFALDLVLLRTRTPPPPPTVLLRAQVARKEHFEVGRGYAITWLRSKRTQREIEGKIAKFTNEKGMRAFTGDNPSSYWFEAGCSGSPVFTESGMQLAGIISLSEVGEDDEHSTVHEASVVPGTTMWSFLKTVRRIGLTEIQRMIEQAVINQGRQEPEVSEALALEIAKNTVVPDIDFDKGSMVDALIADALKNSEASKLIIDMCKQDNRPELKEFLKEIAELVACANYNSALNRSDTELIRLNNTGDSMENKVFVLKLASDIAFIKRDFKGAVERMTRICELVAEAS